ncbi:MAG TPA: hypothetical protein OIL97_04615 [Oscillospiraceae bacterium]|nr:hypothetical protein [Oscillospiraceae bacterium]
MEYSQNFAKQVLEFKELWDKTNQAIIADSVEYFLFKKYIICDTSTSRIKKIVEITGSKQETVRSWLNKSRENVKFPLLKLCELSVALGVDVGEFFEPYKIIIEDEQSEIENS